MKSVPGTTAENRVCFISKKAILGIVIGLGAWGISIEPAESISLTLTPTKQEITIGEVLSLDIAIVDLGNLLAPSVSTFDFDLSFDSNVLEFKELTFGDPLLGDQIDLSGDARQFTELGIFDAVGFSEPGPGVVNLFEVSLDFPQDLESEQPDDFVLATLDFTALYAGNNNFDLTVNTLGDSEGNPLALDAINNSSVLVTDTPSKSVPEPTASWLGLLSFLVVGGWGIRKTAGTQGDFRNMLATKRQY